MEIKGVSVLIQDMKEKISINGDIDVKAYIIGKNKQYIIYVNKTMSRNMAIEIIAHEIIHLFQTEKFKLVKFKDSLMWDNTIYKDPQNIPYMDREWEREAFTYGRLLEKEIKEKLYE